jgi:hypothetical protein
MHVLIYSNSKLVSRLIFEIFCFSLLKEEITTPTNILSMNSEFTKIEIEKNMKEALLLS